MSADRKTQVLIVGAGPVGLTLAIDLTRRGISCRLIDSLPHFPIGTRARGISQRTQEIFDDLGVLDPIMEFDEPRLPTRFYERDKVATREAEPASGVPFVDPLVVNQQFTDHVLRERLRALGASVEMGCRLTGFTSNADTVHAQLSREGNDETIEADYLVGCDGGRSTVRECAGIPLLGQSIVDGATYLLANISVRGLDPGYWHVWTDPAWGYLTLQPMIHGETWLFAATVADAPGTGTTELTTESLQCLFADRAGLADVWFRDLIWTSTYRRNLRIVDRYRRGRILLAGDAAHVGVEHGMNHGIQDACNLGWKLAHVLRGSPERLLDSYEAERLPIVQRILDAMNARAEAEEGGAPSAARSLTNAVLNVDPSADPTQLSFSYRGGPLSLDLHEMPGIRSGDRAPNASCLDASTDRRIHLFDLFRGTHFTLLLFGTEAPDSRVRDDDVKVYRVIRPEQPWEWTASALIDTDGEAHTAYGVNGAAMILVRPDGHVALTGGIVDATEVDRYLRFAIGRNRPV